MTSFLQLVQMLAILLLIPAASVLIVATAVAIVDDGQRRGRHRGTPFVGCHRMNAGEL